MSGMIEKIKERLELHGAVLQRFPKPGYLMILSCFITMLISWIYPIIVYKIAYFQINGMTPYQNFIIEHASYIGGGMWLIPLIVFVVLGGICLHLHQKNVARSLI